MPPSTEIRSNKGKEKTSTLRKLQRSVSRPPKNVATPIFHLCVIVVVWTMCFVQENAVNSALNSMTLKIWPQRGERDQSILVR